MKIKFGKWTNIFIWAVLIIGVIWAGKSLFRYQFYSTHDLDHHLSRSYDAIQTFAEGQFPLRFAGTLNYGCGVPIFNFFYPLLYYLVVMVSPFLKDMFLIFKVISFASLLVGTAFFYLWAKVETGDRWAALAGAILYLYAPYRFILVYVRGSPEYLAYALWPVVLYFYSLAFNETKFKKFLWLTFSATLFGGLLTISHNFTVMFLMPILLLYLILKFFFGPRLEKKRILLIIFSYLSAFGLGAFFIFPAILEQQFTKLSIPTFIYYEHFPELWQVLRSKWGYFYSFPGIKDDGMAFQLGYAHWAILGIVFSWIAWRITLIILKGKRLSIFLKENIWVTVFYVLSLLSLFLTLSYSRPIWDKITLLQDIQFPWRLLGIDVLVISTVFVFWLGRLKSKFFYWFFLITISLLAFVGNRNHLLSEPVMDDMARYYQFPETNPLRFSWGSVGPDVLPKDMVNYCYFTDKFVSLSSSKDEISYKVIDKKSISGSVTFSLGDIEQRGEKLVLNLSYFPGVFKFSVNGQGTSYENCDGRVCIPVSSFRKGDNFVSWKVVSTPTETLFNWVTIAFFIIWIFILIGPKRLKPFWPLIVIFTVFMFFRIYNINGRVGFGWDQERDARAAVNILSGHFTLLGPRVQGPMGFFLPPYFFYLLAPFYAIAGQSPYATTLFIGFWSVLFFVSALFVISKVINRKVALIFLALWAVHPLAISIDTIAWNPVAIPLLVLVMIYLIHSYLLNRNIRNLFLMGLTLGIGISFHVQFLFVSLLLVPIIIDIFKWKKFTGLLSVIIGLLVPFLPIFIFDLRHNFLNAKLIIGFLGTISQVNRVFLVWDRVVAYMLGIPPTRIVSVGFYIAIAVLLLWFSQMVKDKIQRKIFTGLGATWVATLPVIYILVKNPSEYYFNYMLVIALLVSAYLLSLRKFGTIVLLVLVTFFVWKSIPAFYVSYLNLQEKDASVLFLKEVTKGASPFNVSFDVPANEDSGFRYLLDYRGVKYSGNSKDPLIEFEIPSNRKADTFAFRDIGIYFPTSWRKDNWVK